MCTSIATEGLRARLTAVDTERIEEVAEFLSGTAFPSAPGTMLEFTQSGEEVFGRDVFGILFAGKHRANIVKQLNSCTTFIEPKDSTEGLASFSRPRSANQIGNMKERFGAGLLAWGESGGDWPWDGLRGLVDGGAVVVDPRGKFFDQFKTTFAGMDGMKASKRVCNFSAAQDDGNAAGGQRAGQGSVAGEGLGTKEIVLMGTGKKA